MTTQKTSGRLQRNARMPSAHAAMERAAAAAASRAAKTRIQAAAASRTAASCSDARSEQVDERHPSFGAAVRKSLTESERTLIWVADQLNGVRLPRLPQEKRLQLAAACHHIAIEHGGAIVVLTQEKCFGSALALQRPLVEAYERGLWLRAAATDEEVDLAGKDKFPSNKDIVESLRSAIDIEFAYLANGLWSTLCSYTHTGFQQIGALLSPEGLKSNYRLDEIRQVLRSSDMIQLASAIELAAAAGETALATAVLQRLRAYELRDQEHQKPSDG